MRTTPGGHSSISAAKAYVSECDIHDMPPLFALRMMRDYMNFDVRQGLQLQLVLIWVFMLPICNSIKPSSQSLATIAALQNPEARR